MRNYKRKENHIISMKSGVLLAFLLVLSSVALAQNTLVTCINNQTVEVNTSFDIYVNSVLTDVIKTERVNCPRGCNNATGGINDCNPDPTDPTIFSIVPPMVLFFLSFLLIYVAINAREWRGIQFLFFGVALFLMVVNAWYAQSQAVASIYNVGQVFTQVYYAMIIVTIVVIFYFIVGLLRQSFKNIEKKKHGLSYE